MSTKAVVLSSGGLDSTTCLAVAIDDLVAENVTAVSVSYGQKHSKELDCAEAIAKFYGVRHEVLHLEEIFKQSNCSLLKNSTEDVPEGSYADQQKASKSNTVSTYVPFRNGLMLSVVASFAMSIYPDDEIDIYLGNHADDAAGEAYPDCTPEFTEAISKAIYEGTGHKVHTKSPFVNCNKSGVVKKGIELHVPFELTWSCYNGQDVPCRKCGTCIDREKAFEENNMIDPLLVKLGIER